MDFLESLLAILTQMSPYIMFGFFIAGLLHVFVKPSAMSKHLSGNGLKSVIKAAALGIPLPLCSCGVLPTAVSLKRNGASNAASTSFLIATPQTGVDSIAATWSLLGPAMAVIRPLAALACAILGGCAVGRLTPDISLDTAEAACDEGCSCHNHSHTDDSHHTIAGKLLASARYGFVDMVQHVGKWLVIGLVVAALITVFVPDDLFVSLARYPLLAMLVMVSVAIPMYICATGSIPIALSLMLKGLTPGVAFVMLMAGPAANFASVMVLHRAMGGKATAIYVASVVLTAISVGLAIDLLLPAAWFVPNAAVAHACCGEHSFSLFDMACSAALVLMLVNAFIQNRKNNNRKIEAADTKRVYNVHGMMCAHCQANVQKGIESIEGVELVVVSLDNKTAEVAGNVAPDIVIARIRSLGYEATLA